MNSSIVLQEHDKLPRDISWQQLRKSYLLKYQKRFANNYDEEGVGAYYRVGAEWLDDNTSLVVTTKRNMEKIDFMKMCHFCFANDISADYIGKIYSVFPEGKAIYSPTLNSVITPLLFYHFIYLLEKITRKGLKRNYVQRQENLNTVKGRILIADNLRKNILTKNLDRTYCTFSEYSSDCLENRVLNKALKLSNSILTSQFNKAYTNELRRKFRSVDSFFVDISWEVSDIEIRRLRNNKLYREYQEAIRLAQLIIKQYDNQVGAEVQQEAMVMPFYIDMSKLYELYVYGLMHDVYGKDVIYQKSVDTGYPDFLFSHNDVKLILDTKYKPKLDKADTTHYNKVVDIADIRQLSGYARDYSLFDALSIDTDKAIREKKVLDCILIYPFEGAEDIENPFAEIAYNFTSDRLKKLDYFQKFYLLSVPLPVIADESVEIVSN